MTAKNNKSEQAFGVASALLGEKALFEQLSDNEAVSTSNDSINSTQELKVDNDDATLEPSSKVPSMKANIEKKDVVGRTARLTIHIPKEDHAKLMALNWISRKTITSIMTDALRDYLEKNATEVKYCIKESHRLNKFF